MKKAKRLTFRRNSVFWNIFSLILLCFMWYKIVVKIVSGNLVLHNPSIEDIFVFVGAILLSLLLTVFNHYRIVVNLKKGILTFYNGKPKKVTIPLCELNQITISSSDDNPVLPIITTRDGKIYELDKWYVNDYDSSYTTWEIKNIKADFEHFINKVNNARDDRN